MLSSQIPLGPLIQDEQEDETCSTEDLSWNLNPFTLSQDPQHIEYMRNYLACESDPYQESHFQIQGESQFSQNLTQSLDQRHHVSEANSFDEVTSYQKFA